MTDALKKVVFTGLAHSYSAEIDGQRVMIVDRKGDGVLDGNVDQISLVKDNTQVPADFEKFKDKAQVLVQRFRAELQRRLSEVDENGKVKSSSIGEIKWRCGREIIGRFRQMVISTASLGDIKLKDFNWDDKIDEANLVMIFDGSEVPLTISADILWNPCRMKSDGAPERINRAGIELYLKPLDSAAKGNFIKQPTPKDAGASTVHPMTWILSRLAGMK